PKTGAVVYGNVYTQLLEYIISADLIFYALMVGAVMVMRRKAPALERPYRTFGYPIVPLIYVLLALLVVLDLAYLAPGTSGSGYLLVLTGIPACLIWRRSAVRSEMSAVVSSEYRYFVLVAILSSVIFASRR